MSELRTVRINTTAFDEEDFVLITTLTDEEITKVILPIIKNERENSVEYDNEDLVKALREEYRGRRIEFSEQDYLSI